MVEEDEYDYDEETCITAGQLRAMGVPILDLVPDVGWVPRTSIRFTPSEGFMDPNDSSRFVVKLSVEFTKPFKWLSITAHLDK